MGDNFIFIERSLASQHLIHQNAYTPTINFFGIYLSKCYFWRYVFQGPTKSLSFFRVQSRPPEICNFDCIIDQYNVFRLYISM